MQMMKTKQIEGWGGAVWEKKSDWGRMSIVKWMLIWLYVVYFYLQTSHTLPT